MRVQRFGWFGVVVAGFVGMATSPAMAVDTDLLITEIHHSPASGNTNEQYIEILNNGRESVSLGGWTIGGQVDFAFSDMSLAGGEMICVGKDLAEFRRAHGEGIRVAAGFEGTLNPMMARVELRDSTGKVIDRVDYYADGGWPVKSGVAGASLELKAFNLDNGDVLSWRTSERAGGTPGMEPLPPKKASSVREFKRQLSVQAQRENERAMLKSPEPGGAVILASSPRVAPTPPPPGFIEWNEAETISGGEGKPFVLYFQIEHSEPCAEQELVLNASGFNPPLDRATFLSVDLAAERAIAKELKVARTPTWIFYDGDGRERARLSGVARMDEVARALATVAPETVATR